MHYAHVCELEAICALLSNSDDAQYTDDRWFCNSATYSNAVKFWIIFQVVMCTLVFGFDTSDEHVGIYWIIILFSFSRCHRC